MTNDIHLKFEGPFTFPEGERCIFTSEHESSSGVYLWTFRQKMDDSYLIHYIGEASSFAKRQREHLMYILGLYYGVFDPDAAEDGRCIRVWDGLWRDKSPSGVTRALNEYPQLAEVTGRYISALEVFFASVEGARQERLCVEGFIGWNLRKNHPEAKHLYPDDNRVVKARSDKIDRIYISCDSTIRGLDGVIDCSNQ